MVQKLHQISLMLIIVLLFSALLFGIHNNLQSPPTLPSDTTPLETSSGTTSSSKDKVAVPNFVLRDIYGNEVNFEDLNSKPVVLFFWVSNSENIKEELIEYQNIKIEYGSQVTFIFLNCTTTEGESLENATTFLEENDFSYISPLFDTTGEVKKLFGVTEFPTTAFITQDGYLVSGVIGSTDYDTISAHINNLTTYR